MIMINNAFFYYYTALRYNKYVVYIYVCVCQKSTDSLINHSSRPYSITVLLYCEALVVV